MPGMEFAPPKYAQIVGTVQARIEDGTYPVGELMPSESQLVREFGVSRPTVVRALQLLALEGWIEREHGRGSFVKGRPASEQPLSRPGRALLDAPGGEAGEIIEVGRAKTTAEVAKLLGVPKGSPGLVRRRLVSQKKTPVELVSAWFPLDVADGTDLADARLLTGGVRQHLQAVKHIRFSRIRERVRSRLATDEEARLLGLTSPAPVLNLLVVALDADGQPVQVVDAVLPGDLHELDAEYPAGE